MKKNFRALLNFIPVNEFTYKTHLGWIAPYNYNVELNLRAAIGQT